MKRNEAQRYHQVRERWVFGTMIKVLLENLHLVFGLHCQFELLTNTRLRKPVAVAQVAVALLPMWETRMKFLIPGLSLAQPRMLQAFGE